MNYKDLISANPQIAEEDRLAYFSRLQVLANDELKQRAGESMEGYGIRIENFNGFSGMLAQRCGESYEAFFKRCRETMDLRTFVCWLNAATSIYNLATGRAPKDATGCTFQHELGSITYVNESGLPTSEES